MVAEFLAYTTIANSFFQHNRSAYNRNYVFLYIQVFRRAAFTPFVFERRHIVNFN